MTKPPFYYGCLIGLMLPLYRLWVRHKSGHLPSYERQKNERFGMAYPSRPYEQSRNCADRHSSDPVDNHVYNLVDNLPKATMSADGTPPVIWCHAVSLGELNTAYPLLKILLNQGFNLWITSTTQTGFDRASTLFADEMGRRVNHSFVPVDNLPIIRRFLHHVQPIMAMFVETELWANMLYELRRRQIPVAMMNARLTQKSYEGYAKFAKLSRSMMDNLSLVVAQDADSAQRFERLGVAKHRIKVVDSLKWVSAAQLSDANRSLLQKVQTWSVSGRKIWTVGSTHEGEESLVLQAHRKLLVDDDGVLLIMVPRHPERFDEVATLCQSMGLTTHRRSQGDEIGADTQVYLADSMGELLVWYALADVALVAGSLVDKGGHNPIEPASLAKPVIMGRYIKNCQLLADELSQIGALVQVDSTADDVVKAVLTWLDDVAMARSVGQTAKQLVEQKQTAAIKQAQAFLALQDSLSRGGFEDFTNDDKQSNQQNKGCV